MHTVTISGDKILEFGEPGRIVTICGADSFPAERSEPESAPPTKTAARVTPKRLPELLTPDEAAELANVSRSTWHSLRRSGRTPEPVEFAGPKWVTAELLAWMDAKCPPRTRWEYRSRRN